MNIVIQCAASKRADAGRLRTRDGKDVLFVADPKAAPACDDAIYARPDDASDQGGTWRDVLARYNAAPGNNPLRLRCAAELYTNPAYGRIVSQVGVEHTYILSAGWGLISGSFLTPDYNITFSAVKPKERFKRRQRNDIYRDERALATENAEPVFFFGGKDYVPLFCALTRGVRGERTLFYNSAMAPDAPGCILRRFETTTRTNWHYGCVGAFLENSSQRDSPDPI